MLWVFPNPRLDLASSAGPMVELRTMSRGSAIARRCPQLQSPLALGPEQICGCSSLVCETSSLLDWQFLPLYFLFTVFKPLLGDSWLPKAGLN